MRLKGKKVFVTGAGGFIGSHLTQRLAELGCKVTALVHYGSAEDHGNLDRLCRSVTRKLRVIPGDIHDPQFLRSAIKGQEVVFHLAALISIPYSYAAARLFLETNVLGSLNVFQACLENRVQRVIHTSTSEVYGSARYVPIDERHPLQGQSPYAATKIAADKLAESFYCSFSLPVVIVRPFNTFGPRQSARAVIPAVITQLISNQGVRIGSLFPVRDFNYVDNTVDGFICCAQSDKAVGQTINIGSGKGIAIRELIRKASRITGVKCPCLHTDARRLRPAKSEVSRLLCDYSKARRLTGYEPRVSLEEGLKRTAAWIREHIREYKPQVYKI